MHQSKQKQKTPQVPASQYSKWHMRKIFNQKFKIGEGKETSQKIKLFSYSLIIGIVFMLLFLVIVGINPFAAISDSLKMLSEYKTSQDRMLVKIAIFGFAGIAVSIGFKVGLFNIGVSGQMILGGLFSGLLALFAKDKIPTGLGQILVLLISVIGGALLAAFAGFLKAYFKIHEVVSTILLNWIMFFILQACIRDFLGDFSNQTHLGTVEFGNNYLFTYDTVYGKMGGWIALALLVLAVVGTYILIYKTTFGHKMIIVGKNKDAAQAAGINVKSVTIVSMAISGAIAGLLGVVVYFIQDKNFQVSSSDVIPQYGFDGIAIAILAFSNPLATLPVAVIFGVIQGIIDNTTLIDATFGPLVTGILILTAALNLLFLKFKFKYLFIKMLKKPEAQKKYWAYQEQKLAIDHKYYDKYNDFWYAKKQNLEKVKKQKNHYFTRDKKVIKEITKIKKTFKSNVMNLISQHQNQLKIRQAAYKLSIQKEAKHGSA